MKTVRDLLNVIKGREQYEICGNYNGEFYYSGTYDFEENDKNVNIKTYGIDVIEQVKKENIPLDAKVGMWDIDNFHSWQLTQDGFIIDDTNKLIILICNPFQ